MIPTFSDYAGMICQYCRYFFFLLSNCMFLKEFLNSPPGNETAFIMFPLINTYTGLSAISGSLNYSQNKKKLLHSKVNFQMKKQNNNKKVPNMSKSNNFISEVFAQNHQTLLTQKQIYQLKKLQIRTHQADYTQRQQQPEMGFLKSANAI